ncbi:t-SNARE interacting vesicle transport protein [Acrasis kona]|uniref:t-SNARE interacting vesicle transport protein n=1 Tax=Acrasis kona TaxID=1008807 RepID=A0AAW2ZE10_9EUKA
MGKKKSSKHSKRKELYGDDAATLELGDSNRDRTQNDEIDPATQEVGDEMNADVMLKKITGTQDESLDALRRIVTMNEETIEIGAAAAERLAAQREKLDKIKNSFDNLESGLAKGKKEVNAFMRGLACDNALGKIIILIVIIIALGITALLIMRIVRSDVFDMKNWTEAPTQAPDTVPIQ